MDHTQKSGQPSAPADAGVEARKDIRPPGKLADAVTVAPLSQPDLEPTQSSASSGEFATGEERFDFLTPPQAPDEMGRLGPYRVLKVLGRGGMGLVFQAEDIHLQRLVALKAMLPHATQSPAARQRFLREARAAAQLEHDHIVPIYQVGEDHGTLFIAMPLLKGCSLHDFVNPQSAAAAAASGRSPLTVPVILRIGREIALGLAAAHGRGLIHRDIKPANIWLETRNQESEPEASAKKTSPSEFRVKILDFGLARPAGDDQHLTGSGFIVGTPSYMSLEQAQAGPVDGRSDLFSLGVILYRLCTGRLPFQGSDLMSSLLALATSEPAPPHKVRPEVPQDLSDLVMKLLARQPDQRPSSAREVVQALQVIERGLPAGRMENPSSVSPGSRQTAFPTVSFQTVGAGRGAKRKWAWLIVAALAFLALLAGGIVFFLQTPEGTIRIEINDPNIEVVLTKTGAVIKGVDKHNIILAPGEYGFKIKRDDLEFETDKLILKKGETIALKIELLKGKVQVVQGDKIIGEKGLPPKKDPPVKPVDPIIPVVPVKPPEVPKKSPDNIIADAKTPLLKGHTGGIKKIAFLPDNQRAVSVAWDGKALLWDLATSKEPRNLLPTDNKDNILNVVAVSPDGKFAAVGGSGGYVYLCDLEKEAKPRISALFTKQTSAHALIFSPDSKQLLVGAGTQLVVFDVALMKRTGPTELPGPLVHKVLLAGGKQVLCFGKEELIFWDLEKKQEVKRLPGIPKEIVGHALLPDGKHLAVGLKNFTLQILNLEGEPHLTPWKGHGGFIRTIVPLNDGNWLLTAAEDKTVRIWEVATGKEIFKAEAGNFVTSIAAVSPDGEKLLTGAGWRLLDKTYYFNDFDLRLWQLPLPPPPAAVPKKQQP